MEDEANMLQDIKTYKNRIRKYLTPIPHYENQDYQTRESGFHLPRIKI